MRLCFNLISLCMHKDNINMDRSPNGTYQGVLSRFDCISQELADSKRTDYQCLRMATSTRHPRLNMIYIR